MLWQYYPVVLRISNVLSVISRALSLFIQMVFHLQEVGVVMVKKIDQLREFVAVGDWISALRLAARFPRLGSEKVVITRAWDAVQNPEFYRQIGKCPQELFAAGCSAIKSKYFEEVL